MRRMLWSLVAGLAASSAAAVPHVRVAEGNLQGVDLPGVGSGREHVYHLYVIRHERRDQLAQHLAQRGIQTVINYPVALPFLPAYRRFEHQPADFPVAYHHQLRILSLPMFPEMSSTQIAEVARAIASLD